MHASYIKKTLLNTPSTSITVQVCVFKILQVEAPTQNVALTHST